MDPELVISNFTRRSSSSLVCVIIYKTFTLNRMRQKPQLFIIILRSTSLGDMFADLFTLMVIILGLSSELPDYLVPIAHE